MDEISLTSAQRAGRQTLIVCVKNNFLYDISRKRCRFHDMAEADCTGRLLEWLGLKVGCIQQDKALNPHHIGFGHELHRATKGLNIPGLLRRLIKKE